MESLDDWKGERLEDSHISIGLAIVVAVVRSSSSPRPSYLLLHTCDVPRSLSYLGCSDQNARATPSPDVNLTALPRVGLETRTSKIRRIIGYRISKCWRHEYVADVLRRMTTSFRSTDAYTCVAKE